MFSKGVTIDFVPDRIPSDENYRRCPFILQAVSSGDQDTVKCIQKAGGSWKELGIIAFSTKRKNLVISNAIGCAAWNGHKDVLEDCIKKVGVKLIDTEAAEELDTGAKNPSA